MAILQAVLFGLVCLSVLSSLYFSHRLNLGFYFILSISIIFFLSKNLDHLFLMILFLTLLGGILMLLMFLSSYTDDPKLIQAPMILSILMSGFLVMMFFPESFEMGSFEIINFSGQSMVLGSEVLVILSFLTLLMFVIFIWLA